MRFLADESLEAPIADALAAAGHDVVSVRSEHRGLRDSEVLEWAGAEGRVLLTNDKDFGDLVFRTRRLAAGVILLRLGDIRGQAKAVRLLEVLPEIAQRLSLHFVVVMPESVRLRPVEVHPDTDAGQHGNGT